MPELEPGTTFADHVIRGVAGRGGMGIVYRATHVPLDREVALKVIAPEFSADDEFRRRFRREFRAAASIQHPNVIPIYHAGEEDGLLYVTMRYVEGTDLARLLHAEGRLEPRARGARSSPRSPTRSTPRTRSGSCTATSSPRTCCSRATATSCTPC